MNKRENEELSVVTKPNPSSTSLYCLWRSYESDKFKIQVLFSPTIKFDFEQVYRFSDNPRDKDRNPCIYRVCIDLIKDIQGRLHVVHNNKEYLMSQYALRISDKGYFGQKHHDDEKSRIMNTDIPHQFLFDAIFQKSPPGEKVMYWKQLWFFAYFLIAKRDVDTLKLLIEQFLLNIQADQHHLTKSEFISTIKTASKDLSLIERNLNAPLVLISIIRMLGTLHGEDNNYFVLEDFARKFSITLLKQVFQDWTVLLDQIDPTDWFLFKDGLSILMAIEIFIDENSTDVVFCDSVAWLYQIKMDEKKHESIAQTLLQRLLCLKKKIYRSNWLKLLEIVDKEIIVYDYLNLASTFDVAFDCLEKIVQTRPVGESLRETASHRLESILVHENALTVRLVDIVKVLQYLEKQIPDDDKNAEHTRLMQSVIESNATLRTEIKATLSNFNIEEIHLQLLRDLFRSYNPTLLFGIEKVQYLGDILARYKGCSCEFYIVWFEYFLCDVHYVQTEQESHHFTTLLTSWSNKLRYNHELLMKISMKLDTLINMLKGVATDEKHDRRLAHFIQKMIDIYFQQDPLFQVIADIGPSTRNSLFIKMFEEKFIAERVQPKKTRLKQLTVHDNPLRHLIELHNNQHSTRNELLLHLLSACSKMFQPDQNELLRHTFDDPSGDTSTYAILFEKYFATLPIRDEILDQLSTLWKTWEEHQLTGEQIWRKKNHTDAQKFYFEKIWNAVAQHTHKRYRIEELFDEAQKEIMKKMQIKTKIHDCLNAYCDHANDKEQYMAVLSTMQGQFDILTWSAVHVPTELTTLIPFAERLNLYVKSITWMHFYRSRIQESRQPDTSVKKREDSTDDTSSDESEDENNGQYFALLFDTTADFDDNSGQSIPQTGPNIITTSQIVQWDSSIKTSVEKNCLELLDEATKILELFQGELQKVCTQWSIVPIKQLIAFFPDEKSAENDIRILEPLFERDIVSKLVAIVNFWKDRAYIQQIYVGTKGLLSHFKLILDKRTSIIFDNLSMLNKETKGQVCFEWYQQYLNNFAKRCSPPMLNFCSHYDSASELIEFLHKLSAADIDNLLEAVNDWDETLTSTKTVVEFATLKTFFNRLDAFMKIARDNKPTELGLDSVVMFFDKICKEEEFRQIVDYFSACVSSLSGIKRLYLELTSKEQSKRQRIIDIIQRSSIVFEQNPFKKHEFNVRLTPQNMNFADLSELRDRARLMEHSDSNKLEKEHDPKVEQLKIFIAFVDVIEMVLESLSSLFSAGLPAKTESIAKQSFTCIRGSFEKLEQLRSELEQCKATWERDLSQMYEKYPELTHFSCEDFRAIENFIYNKKHISIGFHLLQYVGFDSNKLEHGQVPPKSEVSVEWLKNLGEILASQRTHSMDTTLGRKIWLVETTDDGILRTIFSLFGLVNSPPRVHQLFYCTTRTNWIELRAFIYRCFFSQTLQILIRPHLLPSHIQDQFMPLIREFSDRLLAQHFCLGIITTIAVSQVQLINALKTLNIVTTVCDQDLLNKTKLADHVTSMLHNCKLVTSRLAGLGKSSWIHQEICRMGKKSIKFPIGGDVEPDKVAQRLIGLGTKLSECALHIDIGLVNNIHTLNELLYCLILFRSFRFGQVAVSLPLDTCIFIELDASPFVMIHDHLAICQYLKPVYIEQFDWNQLNFRNPKIEFVAKFLYAFKTELIVKLDLNEENLKTIVINVAICRGLVQQYFLLKKNQEFITGTQLSIFIAVFHPLFSGFSNCGYFLVDFLHDPQLRLDIIRAFLRSSDQFTSISVENVRNQQRASLKNTKVNEIPQMILTDAVVRWETVQPFTLVFSATNDPLFIYKTINDIPQLLIDYFKWSRQASKHREPRMTRLDLSLISVSEMFPDYAQLSHVQLFLKLTSLSKKYFNKAVCTQCYKQFSYNTKKCTQCTTDDTILQPETFDNNDILIFQTSIATLLESEYVLTPDNYIKMLLVFLRIQSGLPVLIMGETGCGKTALINFLCRKILDDELEVFRIHAGITNDKILKAMQRFIDKANDCLAEQRRLWIFFDEFNTTSSIGLIKEITCERTLLGAPLPENMVFLGACNPRRQKTEKIIFDDNIGIKKDRYDIQQVEMGGGGQPLLYTVVPIPETMLEYVWDYGFLDQDTERKYIETMLKTCVFVTTNKGWFRTLVELISKSQQFMREKEDVSSVSLRDVARFCRLCNWFYASISERASDDRHGPRIIRRAGMAALLLCYYFRLNTIKRKAEFIDMIEENLSTQFAEGKKHRRGFVTTRQCEEQEDIIRRMEFPKGIAKNRALCENIFVLFVCIINRIPLILCGKPGCSKTSAVQIVISNLKGKKSRDPYFQTLPEFIAVSYQGSQNCTSESIEKVFERAGKYRSIASETPLLPVIVFDEIGLAELSPHNPLKVLHADLEVESCQYGFVGISNWRLDASKMNRALYLACADPDVTDLECTSTCIIQDMLEEHQGIQLNEKIRRALASAYYDLFSHLKEQHKHEHYFGLRDFYSLIKGIASEIRAADIHADLFTIIRRQLAINFNGIVDGSIFMWESCCANLDQRELLQQYSPPNLKHLLDDSLQRRIGGRYLMLIAESESVIDYVERYIHAKHPHKTQAVRTLIGSRMPGDLVTANTYTEAYSYRVLMDIILYAETSVTLVMRQLGHLYDNLYDLFNQNFATSLQKRYCRIALGALYHPRCLINDEFHCIVFVNRNDVDKCDPPFLNRFEKQLINIQELVHPQQWTIADRILKWLENLLPQGGNEHFPTLQHLFVDFNRDRICNLVIDTFEELNGHADEQEVIDLCKNKLLKVSSFDLPVVLATRKTNMEENQALINDYYNIHAQTIFTEMLKQNNSKQVIYTYTQVYHTICYDKNEIEEIKLGNFKMEHELNRRIKMHYRPDNRKHLLLIRIDYQTEHKHLLSIKHILLNVMNGLLDSDQYRIWLIIHLQRNMLHQAKNDVLFNGWCSNMIDDLNEENVLPVDSLMSSSYGELIAHGQFILSECLFDELIDRCLSKFRYNVANKQFEEKINQRRNDIINCLAETSDDEFSLRRLIQEKIANLIQKTSLNDRQKRYVDWRYDLLTNARIIATCRSFKDAFQSTLAQFYDVYFLLLFTHLEQNDFIDSFIFFLHEPRDLQRELWFDCFNTTIETIDMTPMHTDTIELALIFHLRLPRARAEYAILCQIRQMIQQRKENPMEYASDDQFVVEQLSNKSVYKNLLMDVVFNDAVLFRHYLHDQLLLFLNEHNIHLSADFALQLLTSNPTVDRMSQIEHLLTNHAELLKLMRIFEKGSDIVSENEMRQLCEKQFIDIDTSPITRNQKFYTLIFAHGCLFHLPPDITDVHDDLKFKGTGDAYIENGMINLIELIISRETINSIKSLERLSTACSLICQDMLTLSNYLVDNLEKLRSFISLIRCITSLIKEQTLDIFKKVCIDGLEPIFHSCQSIHQFVRRLSDTILGGQLVVDDRTIHHTVVKLEIEFLKNWLANNGDKYCDILELIGQKDNDLWRYSAKIFLYIDRKFNLYEMLEQNHGRFPQEQEYQTFEENLQTLTHQSDKIERLFVNRLHMDLILSINEQSFDATLEKEFQYFTENVHRMAASITGTQSISSLKKIGLLAWIKYYAHMYAFALSNNSDHKILPMVDRHLVNTDNSFGDTLKMFILKQLIRMANKTLNQVREEFQYRNVFWIRPLLARPEKHGDKIREEIILPTPLFDGKDAFIRVSRILNEFTDGKELRALIGECARDQYLAYGFYMWFIHYYCHFYTPNTKPDERFLNILQTNLKQTLSTCFEPIGFRFLIALCSNFKPNSYFCLVPEMSKIDLHRRLLALNVIALCLSTRALQQATFLGTLLFDRHRRMPKNYHEHIQSVCLLGMAISDPVVTQMIDVKTQVQQRLDSGQIHPGGKFIFQCSHECLWMFYFANCGVPVERSRCPLCKKEIGAERYGVLIARDPPQIQMTIQQGFDIITQHVNEFNQQVRLGYYNVTHPDQSSLGEKPDHFNRPISFRFSHMITHAQLLVLQELEYLPVENTQKRWKVPNRLHFQQHYDKDCDLLMQTCTDPNQYYVWLYKLVNHMLSPLFIMCGVLDDNTKVIEIERSIEQKLIFTHIDSIGHEISQYRVAYAEFIRESNAQPSLIDYLDELCPNQDRYPFLHFFNFSRIITANPLDEFRIKIQNLPFADQIYPVTTFLFKRFDDYMNIQYLYPIVEFTNFLLDKYNHRIQRNEAAVKTFLTCLQDKKESNGSSMRTLFDQFLHAWYMLDLKEVRFGCQTPPFTRPPRENFERDTSLAFLLLNVSKDASSILPAACLRTLGEMQNEIVNYFYRVIVGESTNIQRISVQAITPEHVLRLDRDELSAKLVTDSFVINYEYGQGRDLIYDHEEIEMTLRNLVSSLQLLDTENLHFLNYQFELYAENTSLITHIRHRVPQQSLPLEERIKLAKLLAIMTDDEIVHYLGSLDYIFTYLCNADESVKGYTIQAFVEQYILRQSCLNEFVFRRPPFSFIPVTKIISLYELVEEIAFDQVLRAYVRAELREAKFTEEASLEHFIAQTFAKPGISFALQSSAAWIAVLKRLLIRVLGANITLDVELQIYLERADLWSDNILEQDLQLIEINGAFLLRHTYIILLGLEAHEKASRIIEPNTQAATHVQSPITKTTTWHQGTTNKKVVLNRLTMPQRDQKLRV